MDDSTRAYTNPQSFMAQIMDSDPEKTREVLEILRGKRDSLDTVIAEAEASLYRAGVTHIGTEDPEVLTKDTRLLHTYELAEAALGNMNALIQRLHDAGKPGTAALYREYAASIQKGLDAELKELLKGPNGQFLRESGAKPVADETPTM